MKEVAQYKIDLANNLSEILKKALLKPAAIEQLEMGLRKISFDESVKCYFKSSDWFKRIIDVSSIFKDINEHMTMEESGMLLDFFGYILGCIYYNRCLRDRFESYVAKKFNMPREGIIFKYHKLVDVISTPKSSEIKNDEEFQKKIEAELKDTKHIIDSVFGQAALEVMLNDKED